MGSSQTLEEPSDLLVSAAGPDQPAIPVLAQRPARPASALAPRAGGELSCRYASLIGPPPHTPAERRMYRRIVAGLMKEHAPVSKIDEVDIACLANEQLHNIRLLAAREELCTPEPTKEWKAAQQRVHARDVRLTLELIDRLVECTSQAEIPQPDEADLDTFTKVIAEGFEYYDDLCCASLKWAEPPLRLWHASLHLRRKPEDQEVVEQDAAEHGIDLPTLFGKDMTRICDNLAEIPAAAPADQERVAGSDEEPASKWDGPPSFDSRLIGPDDLDLAEDLFAHDLFHLVEPSNVRKLLRGKVEVTPAEWSVIQKALRRIRGDLVQQLPEIIEREKRERPPAAIHVQTLLANRDALDWLRSEMTASDKRIKDLRQRLADRRRRRRNPPAASKSDAGN